MFGHIIRSKWNMSRMTNNYPYSNGKKCFMTSCNDKRASCLCLSWTTDTMFSSRYQPSSRYFRPASNM